MDSDAQQQTLFDSTLASTDETEVLAEYRSVSPLAVVGLLFGLASPLVFVAPLLLALPLFGVGISLVALFKIQSYEGQLIGRGAALVGLVLSVVFGCAVLSHNWTSGKLISIQAKPIAQKWLEHLIAGEDKQAFSMTTAFLQPGEGVAKKFPGLESDSSPMERFLSDPVIAKLRELEESYEVKFTRTMGFEQIPNKGNYVQQEYAVSEAGTSLDHETLSVLVTLKQSRVRFEKAKTWRISGYEFSGNNL